MTRQLDRSSITLLFGPEGATQVPILGRGVGTGKLLLHCGRRELSLLRCRGSRWRPRGWRRFPSRLRGGPREHVSGWLSAGAVLPLQGLSVQWRELLETVEFQSSNGPPAVGMDGSLRLFGRFHGEPGVLRIGRSGRPSDPSASSEALTRLAGLRGVPAILARGGIDIADETWTYSVEERLPGRVGEVLSDSLLEELVSWSLELPSFGSGETPLPTVTAAVRTIADATPEMAPALERLVAVVNPESLVGAPMHGDLWARNLLLQEGQLSGVVDWDGFDPVSVAGVDLVHAVATQLRLRTRRAMGEVVTDHPWRQAPLAHALDRMLGELGAPMRSGTNRWDSVGIAWWLLMTATSLRRLKDGGMSSKWLVVNVYRPLSQLDGQRWHG